ncbi:hypothetical protein ACXNSR_20285 [Streptomyces sp. NC-S4]
MIDLSVDATSQSFAAGQATGTILVAAIALTFLWRLTKPWRNVLDKSGIAPAERKRLQGRRNQVVVLVTVVITVFAAMQLAGRFGREADDTDNSGGGTRQGPVEPFTVRPE